MKEIKLCNKNRWMCKHYLNGFCKYGNRCNFAHGRKYIEKKCDFVILNLQNSNSDPALNDINKGRLAFAPGSAGQHF